VPLLRHEVVAAFDLAGGGTLLDTEDLVVVLPLGLLQFEFGFSKFLSDI
jgi:hypothetical protein